MVELADVSPGGEVARDPGQEAADHRTLPLGGRRLKVVANPRAANGEVAQRWSDIRREVEAAVGGPISFEMTDAPMAATRLTRQALRDGFDIIASLGGDGTHNETINGFFDEDGAVINPEAALAILPCGTGGDFRKTLGLSGDMAEAAARLASGAPRPLDVGRMRYTTADGGEGMRHFLNIASFGISGLVDHKVNQTSKALGGTATFALGLARALAEFEPQRVRMVIDERIDAQLTINVVAVANGRYFGGGMKMAPFARLDDGFFDVVIIRDLELGDLLRSGLRVYEGRHIELPGVSHLQARALRAEPMDPNDLILLDVDGEAPGQLPASFEVLPGVVRLWA